MSEATKPEPEIDLLANAQELLERYRLEEGRLELERNEINVRLDVVRDVIGSLTARKRAPRGSNRRRDWPAVVTETGPLAEMGETIDPDPMPPAA